MFGNLVPGEAPKWVKIGLGHVTVVKNGVGGGETVRGFAGKGVEGKQ